MSSHPAFVDGEDAQAILAVACHELRHPLHLMRLAVARAFPRGDEEGRLKLERYINHMSRILVDVSDLLRIEQDTFYLERARVDAVQLLRDVADAYAADATARRVKLSVELPNHPVVIDADTQRILQVVANVLDNALKFTPPGGAILVSMLACGDTIDLRVRDTGVGIDRSFLPRVFQLYQSAHLPRGNGIGLTVARHIVELHDGSIEVTSGGVNQGAEVRISLPIDRVQVPETV